MIIILCLYVVALWFSLVHLFCILSARRQTDVVPSNGHLSRQITVSRVMLSQLRPSLLACHEHREMVFILLFHCNRGGCLAISRQ
jgi:hypothetical protein